MNGCFVYHKTPTSSFSSNALKISSPRSVLPLSSRGHDHVGLRAFSTRHSPILAEIRSDFLDALRLQSDSGVARGRMNPPVTLRSSFLKLKARLGCERGSKTQILVVLCPQSIYSDSLSAKPPSQSYAR